MRGNALDDADVFRIVRKWADTFRSEAAAASSIGITRQTLNDQMNASAGFSESVLRAAGLRRVVTEHYEFLENGDV